MSTQPFEGLGLRGAVVLVIASTGGHLAQAVRINDHAGLSTDSVFVTFESPQSSILTKGRNVVFVPYVAPRDARGIARTTAPLRKLLSTRRFDAALSTGAGIALPGLLIARRHGVRALYVESFSRVNGPSTTGRIVAHIPGVETYTQHDAWADQRWGYVGSVAQGLGQSQSDAPRRHETGTDGPLKVLVTLGTIRPYRFDALVDRVLKILPSDAEIAWQLGCTRRADLPGRVFDVVDAQQFDELAAEADVVISHAGVGTAISLVEMGRPTILVPRRAARHEHVDDHQLQISHELAQRGLVLHREVEELVYADLKALTRRFRVDS